MRIRLVGAMPARGCSGGRLLALTMAESLAMAGATVEFVTNSEPEMYDEFRPFSRIRLRSAPWLFSRYRRADRSIDLVIVVPHLGSFFQHWVWAQHGQACRARLVLLNFESPNWFNAVSPYKRDEQLWRGWTTVSRSADMILSISGEGNHHARQYYREAPARCQFEFSYPGINTVLADRATGATPRAKQIVMLTRLDPHKGAASLEPLVDDALDGYTVVVCLGNGKLPTEQHRYWQDRLQAVGVGLKVRSFVQGIEKFALLKSSSLVYFPTRFEGFGLPPLEAAYCLSPCACSDLPVLREFGSSAFTYGDPTNVTSMRRAVHDALSSTERVAAQHQRIAEIASMQAWGNRLMELFAKIV